MRWHHFSMVNGKIEPETATPKATRCLSIARRHDNAFCAALSTCVMLLVMAVVFIISVIAYYLLLHKCNCSSLGGTSKFAADAPACQGPKKSPCCTTFIEEHPTLGDDRFCTRAKMDQYQKMGGMERGWQYLFVGIAFVTLYHAYTIFLMIVRVCADCTRYANTKPNSRGQRNFAISDASVSAVIFMIIYAVFLLLTLLMIGLWAMGVNVSLITYGLVVYWFFYFGAIAFFLFMALMRSDA